jgi:hypothetical protein
MNESSSTEEAFTRGVFCVVGSDRVESMTRLGWSVHSILSEDENLAIDEPFTREEWAAHDGVRNYHPGPMMDATGIIPVGYKRRHVLARRLRFVLIKDEESALGEMAAELELKNDAIRELERKGREGQSVVAAAAASTKKNEELQAQQAADIQAARAALEQEKASRHRERETHTKIERDMTKVRAAIGELKWKELVG